jgi:ribonuclease R
MKKNTVKTKKTKKNLANNQNPTTPNNATPKTTQRRKSPPRTTDTFEGILDVSKNGMGFVMVPELDNDIKVNFGNLNSALHGDRVVVKVMTKSATKIRLEGVITNVIDRKHKQVVGTLQITPTTAFLIPNNKNINTDFYIAMQDLNGAKDGDKVVAGHIKYDAKRKNPSAVVLEKIDGVRASDFAMKELILDAGFPLEFSQQAYAEMEALSTQIDEQEINNRIDFRDTLTLTIDPVDAKDFDDAISIKKLDKDNYEIGVHIADVSHYVKEGSQLDEEAYARATSVYLPDRVNPMLPEKISNELCSLRPHEDKLTFSAIFEMNSKGEVKHFKIARTIIHSNRRFTYEEVQEMIEGAAGDYKEELMLLNTISQNLRAKRFNAGAINFSSTEVRFVLDEEGTPIGVKVKESKAAHQLIEELMLLANRTVATFVNEYKPKGKQVPFPYRIHDQPDVTKLSTFATFASKFGYRMTLSDGQTIAASFNQMLANSKDKPEKGILETLGIRCMAKAAYSTKNIGHYGLAFEYYAHFTSPIRRYPDVMVHRVLQQVLDADVVLDPRMEDKCIHSSAMERKAMECERDANKYKQVEFMKQHVGETFEGLISGVSHFGFWVETVAHKCEGLVSLKNLVHIDNFKYYPEDYCLIGDYTKQKIKIGDKVTIIVAAANLDTRMLDYELVQEGA